MVKITKFIEETHPKGGREKRLCGKGTWGKKQNPEREKTHFVKKKKIAGQQE